MNRVIRVMIIDDSALVRRLTAELLQCTGKIEVVATAQDPIAALPKIAASNPDVILLDINMPRMDGLQFLRELRLTCSIPVIMISTLTEAGSEQALRALELGAVDFVSKPKLDVQRGLEELGAELAEKIVAAASSRGKTHQSAPERREGVIPQAQPAQDTLSHSNPLQHIELIAIAASTGGTEALRSLFEVLPEGLPPIVIVQHMRVAFTKSFAKHLDQIGVIRVKEAEEGDMLTPGCAYVAPGDLHLEIHRAQACYVAHLSTAPQVNGHRPSADVLFQSCADALGSRAVGIILTGMGHDGAKGLLAMRAQGAMTIAQNEESSFIFGMPRVAIENGAASRILPLLEIPTALTVP